MSFSINSTTPDKNQCRAAIALGSNLGESISTVEKALSSLDQIQGIEVVTCSSWYSSQPVGPPQPDYINGCALLKVDLTPHQLLETLLQIENEFGRVRLEHWGPRTLDLDLILYDNFILNTPNLQVPHPRMKERGFVLLPLAEIAPHWVEPTSGKTIIELLENVNCSQVLKVKDHVEKSTGDGISEGDWTGNCS